VLQCYSKCNRVINKEALMSGKDAFKPVLECTLAHALNQLAGADTRPVCATVDLKQLRERFARPLPQAGTDPVTVIDDLVRDADGGIVGSTGGRFFGWVIGGTLPAALAADWMTSVIGMARPRSRPASERSWLGAAKTRSTPCLSDPTAQSP
jgi:hypothetical protein